jgi:hypothetical protein
LPYCSRHAEGGGSEDEYFLYEGDDYKARNKAKKQVDRRLKLLPDPEQIAELEDIILHGGRLPSCVKPTTCDSRQRRAAEKSLKKRVRVNRKFQAQIEHEHYTWWVPKVHSPNCPGQNANARVKLTPDRHTPHPNPVTSPSPCPSPPPSARSSRESTPMDIDYPPDTILDEIFAAGGNHLEDLHVHQSRKRRRTDRCPGPGIHLRPAKRLRVRYHLG